MDYEEKGKAAEAEVKASPEDNGLNEEEMPVFTDMEEPWESGEEYTGACEILPAQEAGQEPEDDDWNEDDYDVEYEYRP